MIHAKKLVLVAAVATGVAHGQNLVRDVNSTAPNNPGSNPQRFVDVGADTYFTAFAGPTGTELYRIDGITGAATLEVVHQGAGFPHVAQMVHGEQDRVGLGEPFVS